MKPQDIHEAQELLEQWRYLKRQRKGLSEHNMGWALHNRNAGCTDIPLADYEIQVEVRQLARQDVEQQITQTEERLRDLGVELE